MDNNNNMGTKHEMVCLADFEKFARSSLPKMAMDYYSSGADEEVTLADNRKAFRRFVASVISGAT